MAAPSAGAASARPRPRPSGRRRNDESRNPVKRARYLTSKGEPIRQCIECFGQHDREQPPLDATSDRGIVLTARPYHSCVPLIFHQ